MYNSIESIKKLYSISSDFELGNIITFFKLQFVQQVNSDKIFHKIDILTTCCIIDIVS